MLAILARAKSFAARLGRLESLAAELRAARLAEEKAHAAYHAESQAVRRFIADRRKPDGRDVDAVVDQLAQWSVAVESLAEAARRSTQARRSIMLRLESAVLD